jgi:hypothetical protein
MNSSIQSINKYIVKLNTEINLLVTKKDNMEVDNEKLKELRDNLSLDDIKSSLKPETRGYVNTIFS